MAVLLAPRSSGPCERAAFEALDVTPYEPGLIWGGDAEIAGIDAEIAHEAIRQRSIATRSRGASVVFTSPGFG